MQATWAAKLLWALIMYLEVIDFVLVSLFHA